MTLVAVGWTPNLTQDHIMEERRLLMEMDHPFILKLHDSFQDER